MKTVIWITLLFAISTAKSQTVSNDVNDSTLSVFELVQKEIRTKEIGNFEYVNYYDNGKIQSKVKIKNFYTDEKSGEIWTIVSRYEYKNNGALIKKSFWKTDNISKACNCNVWYQALKSPFAYTTYYKSCKKIKLNCDEEGRFATK